jgi:hypothetical protein
MKAAILLLALYSFACGTDEPTTNEQAGYAIAPEVTPVEIRLASPFDSADFEYSGLATVDEKLVLLPQYFLGFDKDTTGYLFTIDFARLDKYISGEDVSPITPDSIEVHASGLERFNHHGSGYEAIVFSGDNVFLAIEDIGDPTNTFLVKGEYFRNDNLIIFNSATLTEIPQQTHVRNYGYETLVKCDENLIAIAELNGANNVANPKAYEYDAELNAVKNFALPKIEYRITDATTCDDNTFWVINYFWPGDLNIINPASDWIAEKYGMGEHQSITKGVERILKLTISGDSIKLASPPVYIKPSAEGSSNWEGIAKFRDGFLLVTDSYPKTRLIFVKDNADGK